MAKRKGKEPHCKGRGRTIEAGRKIGRIVRSGKSSYTLMITVTSVVYGDIHWKISDQNRGFKSFDITTDKRNRFTVTLSPDSRIPEGILAEAVCLILNELYVFNKSETPSFFLGGVNPYLFNEFETAGFKKDRTRTNTTMVCQNW